AVARTDDAELGLARAILRQALGDFARVALAVLGMDDLEPAREWHAGRTGRQTGLLDEGRRQPGDALGSRLEVGEPRGLVHQPQALFAPTQGAVGLPALADVARDAHVRARAVGAPERHRVRLDVPAP